MLEHPCLRQTADGTLPAGKCADMIVIDGNPLEDVRLFAQPDKVVMVMKEGKVLKDLLASA
jgi:imidazolonepropionase-like amidohydrolase